MMKDRCEADRDLPTSVGATAGLVCCEHKHTGSCSPEGVYLYVRCMDCWKLLAMSDEGARRLDDCPGYEPAKRGYGRDCVHCGFDWWDHQHAA